MRASGRSDGFDAGGDDVLATPAHDWQALRQWQIASQRRAPRADSFTCGDGDVCDSFNFGTAMKKSSKTAKLPEIEHGTEVFGVDPLTIGVHFEVDYIHSYKQDTPFFHGLAKRKLMGSHCARCNYRYATPRSHCMYCGGKTEWFELPSEGRVHSWTVCYFAAQEFLKEVPFTLTLVEFEGVNTLFLSRLIGG